MAKEQKSITDQVSDLIKKAKLLPIPVQTLNEDVDSTRYFGGDLKEFLAAAKMLGAKGIFVETLYLEEDEFFYDSGIDDEEYLAMNGACNCGCCKCGCSDCDCCKGKDEKKSDKKSKKEEKVDGVWLEPEDLEGLDLSLLRPAMAKFQDRVGEACGVRLTVPGVDRLEVEIFSDWYDEFAELVDEASEIIEEDPNGALADIETMLKEQEAAAKAIDAKEKGTKKIAVHPPKKSAKAK